MSGAQPKIRVRGLSKAFGLGEASVAGYLATLMVSSLGLAPAVAAVAAAIGAGLRAGVNDVRVRWVYCERTHWLGRPHEEAVLAATR